MSIALAKTHMLMLKGSVVNFKSTNEVNKYLKIYFHVRERDEAASNRDAMVQIIRKFVVSIQHKLHTLKERLCFQSKLLSSSTTSSSSNSSKKMTSTESLLKHVEAGLFQVEELEFHLSETYSVLISM